MVVLYASSVSVMYDIKDGTKLVYHKIKQAGSTFF